MTLRVLAARASLLMVAVVTGAASPPRDTQLAFGNPTVRTVSSVTAAAAPSHFTPAPVPDIDLQFSGGRDAEPATVSVKPRVFHQQETYHGEGYTPYSTIQEEQPTRHMLPTAGLNLSVPLE